MPQDNEALLSEVRAVIDAKYQAAVAGLDAIRDFLGGSHVPPMKPGATTPSNNGASFRKQVFSAMDKQWRTVKEIADRADVSEINVRGVVYAKSLSQAIKKRKRGGKAQFRLVPDSAPAE